MAHLHHAHPRSAPVVELRLGLQQDPLRQGRRPGCEVEDPILGLGLGLGRRRWGTLGGGGAGDGGGDPGAAGEEDGGGGSGEAAEVGLVLEEEGVRSG